MGPFKENIVVFDVETKQLCPKSRDLSVLSVSVACLFDYETDEYSVYLGDNIHKLIERINRADLVTGFNIKNFDIPVLNHIAEISNTNVYDIFEHSKNAIGHPMPPGTRLDDHLQAMFGEEHVKTAQGYEAPLFYKSQQWGRLISYCLSDVKREKMVFDHIWEFKNVTTMKYGLKEISDPRYFMRK